MLQKHYCRREHDLSARVHVEFVFTPMDIKEQENKISFDVKHLNLQPPFSSLVIVTAPIYHCIHCGRLS